MYNLVKKIENLKESNISNIINDRIKEFKNVDKESNNDLFNEMCFCLLTANFNAEKSIAIQNEIGDCFLSENKDMIAASLKRSGHRFPNTRAEYISKSILCKNKLKTIVKCNDKNLIRDWFVKNVKGLGYKEASHFLRNIGFDDYAIIDFHIIDVLVRNNLIDKPKSITKKKYLEIEKKLKELANKTNLTLAELDLYLWYIETGKILK